VGRATAGDKLSFLPPYRELRPGEHVFAKMNPRLLKDDERNVNEAGDKIDEAVDCSDPRNAPTTSKMANTLQSEPATL
jgi:hypothetical protein